MKLNELDYKLPKELIAQFPTSPRDHSRLMVIDRKSGEILHNHFYDLPKFLTKNDVLVFNKTKVFPARIFGKKETQGKVEVLLLKNISEFTWEVITKPGIDIGEKIIFDGFNLKIIERNGKIAIAEFNLSYIDLLKKLEEVGHTPLPPYISSKESEENLRKKYQTVYAEKLGSAAAPTAGLHFTKRLLKEIHDMGVQIEYVTLHVGLGTFEPVHEETLEKHKIHEEYFDVSGDTYERLVEAKKSGKRIIAVGTTTVRVLESLPKRKGYTDIFIYPPYKFKFVDSIITNFHLPKSTLLALVYAFANEKIIKKAYETAVKEKYGFFSFGDAMLII
ncbi:MAG TPA: tRNA preQ1(34) S-adenosylmethionine ribosyltransferase-isomerase QueA [Candidatus Saccharimonadales bacterium]|nr:tRNA preQ1(34) S-adenosylmethionine ribosyltransferase-isomerase QueA [Candidatus Saccharimonadales bacterium]